jgi:hypothetical protein
MRLRAFPTLFAISGSLGAATTEPGETPMAWRYSLLQTAQNFFNKHAATQAPGAVLAFSLPKVDATQADKHGALACAAQIEMAKDEGFRFRAVLASVSILGFKVCDELEVTKIDAPAGAYDTVTIEEDEKRLVQSVKAPKPTKLGDKSRSDNARISYTVNEQTVQ